MLKDITHTGGVKDVAEIQFATSFGYMFPELAHSPECRLPEGQDTTRALIDLGKAMATDAIGSPDENATTISSFFTYFGQFIDHDLTARTDRETDTSQIFAPDGNALPITPRDPDEVVTHLKNGRRPQFDLDSAYGDGPPLASGPGTGTEAAGLYTPDYKFRLQDLGGGKIDLSRPKAAPDEFRPNQRVAMISDMRNDENINVSQLHAAMLAFHNAIMDGLASGHGGEDPVTGPRAYVRARQYVRWVYQFIVVNQYLKTVCLPSVVDDTLRNGPIFYGSVAGGQPLFMPLEFSVAAFRFGHSMIRPRYALRGTEASIEEIMGPSTEQRPLSDPADPSSARRAVLEATASDPENAYRLKADFTVDWSKFFGSGAVNFARKIDPLIAAGLGSLTFESRVLTAMAHLAVRNLLRSFSLAMPTGQAVASACGVEPLKPAEMVQGLTPQLAAAISANGMAARTPLWCYLLREAQVQTGGETLGVLGSRIVAETMIGLLKKDPNSYLGQYGIARNITKLGIEVPTVHGRKVVGSIEGVLYLAGVYPDGSAYVAPARPRDWLGRFLEDLSGKTTPRGTVPA